MAGRGLAATKAEASDWAAGRLGEALGGRMGAGGRMEAEAAAAAAAALAAAGAGRAGEEEMEGRDSVLCRRWRACRACV